MTGCVLMLSTLCSCWGYVDCLGLLDGHLFPPGSTGVPLLTSQHLGHTLRVSGMALLLLQMRLPWRAEGASSATLPMGLLTSIVAKEALLPKGMAAFAATQLLPVIRSAAHRVISVSVASRQYSPHLCKELLVSTNPPCCFAGVVGPSLSATHTFAVDPAEALAAHAKSSRMAHRACPLTRMCAVCSCPCRRCAPTWRPARRGLCCSGTGTCSRLLRTWCSPSACWVEPFLFLQLAWLDLIP